MRELDTGELVHQKVRIDNPLAFGPLREATVLVDAAAGMAYEMCWRGEHISATT